MNQSGESCGADARAIKVVVLDARERHAASGKTLRAEIDPSLVLDDVARTLDALAHLVDFAFEILSKHDVLTSPVLRAHSRPLAVPCS